MYVHLCVFPITIVAYFFHFHVSLYCYDVGSYHTGGSRVDSTRPVDSCVDPTHPVGSCVDSARTVDGCIDLLHLGVAAYVLHIL